MLSRVLPAICISVLLCASSLEIWNFSARFERSKPVAFRDFMRDAEDGKIEMVTINGQKVSGIYRTNTTTFHTYAPAHYEGLANMLEAQGILMRRR